LHVSHNIGASGESRTIQHLESERLVALVILFDEALSLFENDKATATNG
jgi:hypothetical protein